MLSLASKIPTYTNPPGVRVVVLDVESTGQQGVSASHPKHQVIQVCALDIETKETYMQYCRPAKGVCIPPGSTAIHKIGQAVVDTIGVSQKEAMEGLLAFMQKVQRQGERVLVVAHNAPYDQHMIVKTLEDTLGMYANKDFVDHPWLWLDTLTAFRELYPQVGRQHWPEERPYSLGCLMEKFHPTHELSDAHNAMADVVALSVLFVEDLLHKFVEDFRKGHALVEDPSPVQTTEALLSSRFLTTHCPKGPRQSKRLYLASEVRSFGPWRTAILQGVCNQYLTSLGDKVAHLLTTPGLFTCQDLLHYGYEKYKRRPRKSPTEPSLPWWGSLREVEVVLREHPLNINSDEVIGGLLAHVCDVDIVTFTRHTMKDDGSGMIFPCCMGEPVAYLPLVVSERDAKSLLVELGYRSMSDILVSFTFTPDDRQEEWVRHLNSYLEKPYTLHELFLIIKKVKQFG